MVFSFSGCVWSSRPSYEPGEVKTDIDGAQDDLDVEPERPVLDVEVVEPGSLVDRGVAAQAVDLRPAGQAAGHPVPGVRTRGRARPNSLDEVRPLGPRADQAHVAPQDVEQLGQLVQRGDRGGAGRPARPGRRERCSSWSATRARSTGRSERNFSSWKRTPSQPTRSWRKMTPATALEADRDAHSGRAAATAAAMASAREHDVDNSLELPAQAAVGRPAQPDQRQVTEEVHVVADLGHLVQPRQHEDLAAVPLARPHQRDRLLVAHRRPGSSSSACGWCRSSTVVSSDGPPISGSAKSVGIVAVPVDEAQRTQAALRMSPQLADHVAARLLGPDHDGRMRHRSHPAQRADHEVQQRPGRDHSDTDGECVSRVRSARQAAGSPPSSIATAISQRRKMHGRSSSTDSASRDRYRPPSWNSRIRIAANASSVVR